jgi:hypothetical protein
MSASLYQYSKLVTGHWPLATDSPFAPSARNAVPVIEKLFQSSRDQYRCDGAPEKTEWRLVVYVITQYRSLRVRLDDMPVTPTSKRSLNLHIFKQARRLINGMLRYPLRGDRSQNLCLDYCLTTHV